MNDFFFAFLLINLFVTNKYVIFKWLKESLFKQKKYFPKDSEYSNMITYD